jgi:hypothetical protein
MFELAASGKALTEIAEYATGEGWRTRNGYSSLGPGSQMVAMIRR